MLRLCCKGYSSGASWLLATGRGTQLCCELCAGVLGWIPQGACVVSARTSLQPCLEMPRAHLAAYSAVKRLSCCYRIHGHGLWKMFVPERPCWVLLSFLGAALCLPVLLQPFHVSSFLFSLDLSSSPPGPYGQEMYVYRPEERFKSPPILPPHLLQVILNKDTNISVGTSILVAHREPHWGWKGSPVCREPEKSITFPINHADLAPCSAWCLAELCSYSE